MSKTLEQVAEEIRADLTQPSDVAQQDQLEATTADYSLADAIYNGSKYGEQAYGWGNGLTMCALSAAYADATARHAV